MSLDHIILDVGIIGGSIIADNLSTHLFVKRESIDVELSNETREGMKRDGPGIYLLKSSLRSMVLTATTIGALYGFDYLLTVQNNFFNLHHNIGYIYGGLKYLSALGNVAGTYGFQEVANVAHFPVKLLSRTFVRDKYRYK